MPRKSAGKEKVCEGNCIDEYHAVLPDGILQLATPDFFDRRSFDPIRRQLHRIDGADIPYGDVFCLGRHTASSFDTPVYSTQ